MKVYDEKNVLEAAADRIEQAFYEFNNIYLCVSGGKDSSVMLQLAASVVRKMNMHFGVLFIDLEAQYKETINHIEELRKETDDVADWYWVAMPISLRNAVSVIQPKWICWDKADQNKWVRNIPKNAITEENYPEDWVWFKKGMEFEEFTVYFAEWISKKSEGIIGCGIGIRSDESMNRFRTIVNNRKIRYKNYAWTTKVKNGTKELSVYNFYPIYDFSTEDIWGTIAKLDLKYNYVYEWMYKNGVSIHEQRLCQPYGDDQRNGLDQFRMIEPETWEKVLNRVHGANFGNIYCRTSLLGNMKSEKPRHLTWEQYTVFLLESLGLYCPELRDHYVKKIRKFLRWFEKHEGLSIKDIPEEADKKLESAKKAASWRRIARAIEKNDFWMKRLSFSQTKSDVQRIIELKKKYTNLLSEDVEDKQLKNIAAMINKGVD